jgi:hypothetical protein
MRTEERDEINRFRREVRQLKLERDILSKAAASGDGCDPTEGFRFASAHQAEFPIATMCCVLGNSSSGYYAWRTRSPSRRARSNTALTETVRKIHARPQRLASTRLAQNDHAKMIIASR